MNESDHLERIRHRPLRRSALTFFVIGGFLGAMGLAACIEGIVDIVTDDGSGDLLGFGLWAGSVFLALCALHLISGYGLRKARRWALTIAYVIHAIWVLIAVIALSGFFINGMVVSAMISAACVFGLFRLHVWINDSYRIIQDETDWNAAPDIVHRGFEAIVLQRTDENRTTNIQPTVSDREK